MPLYCFNVVNDFSVSDLRGQDEAIASREAIGTIRQKPRSPIRLTSENCSHVGKVVFRVCPRSRFRSRIGALDVIAQAAVTLASVPTQPNNYGSASRCAERWASQRSTSKTHNFTEAQRHRQTCGKKKGHPKSPARDLFEGLSFISKHGPASTEQRLSSSQHPDGLSLRKYLPGWRHSVERHSLWASIVQKCV
jgi:hypothetical protein